VKSQGWHCCTLDPQSGASHPPLTFLCLCLIWCLAVGLYVKTSEPLNVIGNLLNSNSAAGIAVLQSSQLTRLVANCILDNSLGGVTVEKDCRVELRGNGIYDNKGHGVSFCGDGQIGENDAVGNHGNGIQVSSNADVKASWMNTTHFTVICLTPPVQNLF